MGTGTAANSHRIRFKRSKWLRHDRAASKKAQTYAPPAPYLQGIAAAGATIVNLYLSKSSRPGPVTSTVVEWSLDGSTGWTGVALTGYINGNTQLTTAAVAVGLKYFRVRDLNATGAGPNSNILSVTVT